MSASAQLQELNRVLAEGQLSQAVTLAFELAARGELPLMELFGLAAMQSQAGQPAQAIELYHSWLRHTDSPLRYAARYNLSVLLLQANDEEGAEAALQQALAERPDFIEAHISLGSLRERQGQHEAALTVWRAALDHIHPGMANGATLQVSLLNNLGRLSELRKRYPEAEAALARSLLLDPDQPNVITHWVHLRQKQCAWPVYTALGGVSEQAQIDATSALATLSASDDPERQLAAARRYVKEKVLHGVAPLSDQRGYAHRRLRVGYLSSDFCSHAVSILTAELYGLHDRNVVEVYGFCWSNEDGSGLRARVLAGMDHYVRIADLSDEQAAQCIRAHEIDILVDLHGLTLGARHDILSYRPAPVQITWLGFPGPTGLDSIDYVLADAFVLPPELAQHFTEKPLYLPDTFQINDRQRRIGARPSRAACGLPEQAFVYCSFNNSHKITPEQYALWMRILRRVPGSVLWLVADYDEVRANLSAAAREHGVDPARLYFAERALPSDYLARYQVADLFLDTLPFNAGTTASDALWAGLPLLTRAGRSFPGRMAGSLLHAVGLPELVTHTDADYEELAVRLAQQPQELAALRQRLADHRDGSALFDSPRLVRNLEQLYLSVARGSRLAGAPHEAPFSNLPLVSILIPAARADALAATLRSALAQRYEHCEIIISDSSADGAGAAVVAALQPAPPRLRYLHVPGLDPADNLNRCLALALGQFVACAPAGELLHPDKISVMMDYYQRYPTVGLVLAGRQPLAADGGALPWTPLLGVEAAIGGDSLGGLLLSGGDPELCAPGALLLRRGDAGAALGRYQGRQYHRLAGTAAVLGLLAGRECVYLPQALGSYPQAPADGAAELRTLTENLQLLYATHSQQRYLSAPGQFKQVLAARLTAYATLAAARHAGPALAAGQLEELHQAMRQGYQLLLAG